jgi:hypothetical protein
MSHTDKDKPYWVRLNQEAKYTDHDHRHLGKTYYRRVYLHDENGDRIWEKVPVFFTADQLIDMAHSRLNEDTGRREYYIWSTPRTKGLPDSTYRRAKELHAAGRGHELLEVGTEKRALYRDVEVPFPDHCTEGEPVTREYGNMPCTPDLIMEKRWWRYGESSERQSYLRQLHGRDRTHLRSTLRNVTKAANLRDEGWEDEYEKDLLETTNPYKNELSWLLW